MGNGKYYHCPHCAFSAGHADYCPSYVKPIMSAHEFDSNGYDVWGYDHNGHYNSTFDRAPFQASPHPTCAKCDSGEPCKPNLAAS